MWKYSYVIVVSAFKLISKGISSSRIWSRMKS